MQDRNHVVTFIFKSEGQQILNLSHTNPPGSFETSASGLCSAWWMNPPPSGHETSSHGSRPVCPLSTAHFHNMSRVFAPAPSPPLRAPCSTGGHSTSHDSRYWTGLRDCISLKIMDEIKSWINRLTQFSHAISLYKYRDFQSTQSQVAWHAFMYSSILMA